MPLPRIISLGLILLVVLAPATRAVLSTEDCIRRPDVTAVTVSEDGRHVAFLTPSAQENYDLNLLDTATGQATKFDLGGDDVQSYRWLDSKRMLMGIRNVAAKRYITGIFDITTGAITNHIAPNISLLAPLRNADHLFLALLYTRDQSGPVILNINRRNLVHPEWINIPTGEINGYQIGPGGVLRMVTLFHDKRLGYHYRRSADDKWIKLPLNPEDTTVLGLDDDPDYLYVGHFAPGSSTSTFQRYQVSTGEFGPVLHSDPYYSMFSARLRQVETSPGHLRRVSLDYERSVAAELPLDPEYAAAIKAINSLLPGRLNKIINFDNNLNFFALTSSSGRDIRHLIYNREGNTLTALADPYPWLKPETVNMPKPIKFTARDGVELEGYLILPPPRADGAPPPLIVECRDDLFGRFYWGLFPYEQYYTSRGYALFQPNYRGAQGYNRAISHDEAFNLEKMSTDIADGVQHLITQGLVDGNRIAIKGNSFGAFTALATATQNPGMFRCIIAESGIYDWTKFMKVTWGNGNYYKYISDLMTRKFGSVAENRDQFDAMSPINHVGALKGQVLVIWDEHAGLVHDQTKTLIKKLREHGVPHQEVELERFYRQDSRFENPRRRLEAFEAFLAKNL